MPPFSLAIYLHRPFASYTSILLVSIFELFRPRCRLGAGQRQSWYCAAGLESSEQSDALETSSLQPLFDVSLTLRCFFIS